MNWETEGFLVSKRKFRENANIINVFTKSKGRVSGIVYGGNSRKIRNYLQLGNKIFLEYNAKSENKIGYLKTELIEPIAPKYFDDKKRASGLLSISGLLNSLLPESQNYDVLYEELDSLIKNFNTENWIIRFILWEIMLIKQLGYGFDLLTNGIKSNQSNLMKIDGVNYKLPNFLAQDTEYKEITDSDIRIGLTLTRNIYMNKFFLPNNLIFPKARIQLEKYFI